MSLILTLAARPPQGADLRDIAGAAPGGRGPVRPTGGGSWSVFERTIDPEAVGELEAFLTHESPLNRFDWSVTPEAGRRKRVLVSDMDSTVIGQECLDELADYAGVKAEVSAITEKAMRGGVDFEDALKQRVAMLAGLPLDALEACLRERVTLNRGARTLTATMRAHGARCVLVSGGFTFFTSRVARIAGFDADRANTLIDDGARLTGEVQPPILGREAKLIALEAEVRALGGAPSDAVAIGDGANDLAMIVRAGLGVAYYAKPVVAERTRARINHTDLTAVLFFQGYGFDEIVWAG